MSIILSLERFTEGKALLAKFFTLAVRFSAKSELTINSADLEVGENDQIISEKQRPLVPRAWSLVGVKIFS